MSTVELLATYISVIFKNLFLEEIGADRLLIILMFYLIYLYVKLIVFHD